MKIGLIGFGSIGSRHAQNLKELSHEVIVLTSRSDVSDFTCVANWKELEEKGPLEAIFVTNETASHISTIEKAIKMNPKAIFVEKPLSHNLENLEEIRTKLEENSISFWLGYNFQLFEPFIRIKEIINQSEIGNVFYIRAFVGQDLRSWRKRSYENCYSSKKTEGGGVVLDLVHDINYPSWMIQEKLEYVNSVVDHISDLKTDVEDFTEINLVSESGIKVSVHQDCVRVPSRRSLEISGEKGSILWDSNSGIITVQKDNGREIENVSSLRNDMYKEEVINFLKKLESGEFFTNIDEAIHDMKIIYKIKKYGNK